MQRAEKKIMHHALFTKTHFVLGRVHIDIHLRRVQLEEQHIGRMTAVIQHIGIRLAHRMTDHLVTNHPAVDEEILQVSLRTGKRRQTHPAMQAQATVLEINRYRLLDKGAATQARDTLRTLLFSGRRRQLVYHFLVMTEAERRFKLAQRDTAKYFLEMIELCFFLAQEATPCRRIEKQIAHFHSGT